jgi:hypothetical protein
VSPKRQVEKKSDTGVLGIRLPVEDLAAFDALVGRLPYANRGAVAREVFRRGLEAVARETAKA